MLKVMVPLFAIAALTASGPAFGQQHDLSDQLMDADAKQFAEVFSKFEKQAERGLPILINEIDRKLPQDANDEAKEKLAKRQANAGVALLKLEQPEEVWPLLKHSTDPRVRSYLIHRFAPLGAHPNAIIKRLDEEPDITIRRALVLSLVEFDEKGLSLDDRTPLTPKLQEMYRTDPDPGLHSAVERLLRTWKQDDWLKQINEQWTKDGNGREKQFDGIKDLVKKDKEKMPQWYVNGQGQTMVVISGPVEFMIGSPVLEVGRRREVQHQRRIDRSFSIASKEVTVEQFRRFHKKHDYDLRSAPTNDCPVNNVSWYEAVKYCNWLNGQEGIPKDQWCYVPNDLGQYKRDLTMTSEFLKRMGYRLPTEAEWEYACRAGAVTGYSFGESEDLLGKYAWFGKNSSKVSHPVGSLKPNDFGLFDMLGNSREWCQDAYDDYRAFGAYGDGKPTTDQDENLAVTTEDRVLRGGSFTNVSSSVRSASRIDYEPSFRVTSIGFRLARTLPSVPLTDLPPPPKGGEIEKTDK